MSFQDFLSEVKTSSSNKDMFYLAPGANVVRILTKPIKIEEAFCIQESTDKATGEKKVYKGSEIVYKGCGYEKYSSAKFVVYAIDSNDQRNEDGTPKIKTLSFGWKVLEGLVEQEKSRELQGQGRFNFPMTLDAIISKNGKGQMNTTYGVAIMFSEANNKVVFTAQEIAEAVSKLPTLAEWKEILIKETQDKHAKFGTPKAEKQLKEEQGDAKEEDVIQLDEETEFTETQTNNGIPF